VHQRHQDHWGVFKTFFKEYLANFQLGWHLTLALPISLNSLFCICLTLVGVDEDWPACFLDPIFDVAEFPSVYATKFVSS
jgi:hypothetical protein